MSSFTVVTVAVSCHHASHMLSNRLLTCPSRPNQVTVTSDAPPVVVTSTVAPADLATLTGSIISSPTRLPGSSSTPTQDSGATSEASSSSDSSSPSASSEPSSSSSSKNGALVGAVAGGIVGGFAFFTLIIVMFCLRYKRSKRREAQHGMTLKNGGRGFSLVPKVQDPSAKPLVSTVGLAANRRPPMSERSRLGSGDVSSILPLMHRPGSAGQSIASSRPQASLPSSHSPMSMPPSSLFTPAPSISGSAARYSIISNGATPTGLTAYDYFDPYGPAEMPVYLSSNRLPPSSGYDTPASTSHSYSDSLNAAAGLHPLSRHISGGYEPSGPQAQAQQSPSRPFSSTAMSVSSSSERHGQRPTAAESHLALAAQNYRDWPISATSAQSSATVRPRSASENEPSRLPPATAGALPGDTQMHLPPPAIPERSPHRSPAQAQPVATAVPTHPHTSSRPPVAGVPGLTSKLSTIQGSISERSTVDHSDSLPNSFSHPGFQLPNIQPSSPLIIQGTIPAPVDPNSAAATLDSSNGTFNSYTGTRKGELHVVGTLSSQGSTLPTIKDSDDTDAISGAGNAKREKAQAKADEARTVARGKDRQRDWSVDSQGPEFWRTGDTLPPASAQDQKSLSSASKAPGAPNSASSREVAPISVTKAHQEADVPKESGHKPQGSFYKTGSSGSRLIEMFDGSDSSDEGMIPPDPFASQSGLGRKSDAPGSSEQLNKQASRSSHSLTQLFRSSPKVKDEALLHGEDRKQRRSGAESSSHSPAGMFLQRTQPSREKTVTHRDTAPPATRRADVSQEISFDQLPQLELGEPVGQSHDMVRESSAGTMVPMDRSWSRDNSYQTYAMAPQAELSSESSFSKMLGRRGDDSGSPHEKEPNRKKTNKRGKKQKEIDIDQLFS